MSFSDAMETVVRSFEAAGVAVLAIGASWALLRAGMGWLQGERARFYGQVRQGVGRSILLGLEVLVIADIVQTSPSTPLWKAQRRLASSCSSARSSASRSRSSWKGCLHGVEDEPRGLMTVHPDLARKIGSS